MKFIKNLTLLMILGLSLSMTVGCGGGDKAADAAPTEQAAATATIKLSGYKFNPNTISITAGTIVTFMNEDPEVHNVRIPALNIDENIEPGASWTYTFATAGEFAVDNRMTESPMQATITVQ